MNAILIHGTCDKKEYFNPKRPSLSNSHWFPWIQKQLIINGISTQTPEIPQAHDPDYAIWKKELERYDIDQNTILVGHSCGGGFLVRWMSENKINIKQLILVAPWIDPLRKKTTNFFEFEIDTHLSDRARIHVFNSIDDMDSIQVSVNKITAHIPGIILHEYKDMGHFTFGDMKTEEFPQLLEVILDTSRAQ